MWEYEFDRNCVAILVVLGIGGRVRNSKHARREIYQSRIFDYFGPHPFISALQGLEKKQGNSSRGDQVISKMLWMSYLWESTSVSMRAADIHNRFW
jgi:hypothetical protein